MTNDSLNPNAGINNRSFVFAKPTIYVACLASYNNGILHGVWLDMTQSAEKIHNEIWVMLTNSPIPGAEDFAIHDYENFYDFPICENTGVGEAVDIAKFVTQYGRLGAAVFDEYGCIEFAKKILDNNYLGVKESKQEFAKEVFEETYGCDVLAKILTYIDYEKYSSDIFIDSYFSITVEHKLHVFSGYEETF